MPVFFSHRADTLLLLNLANGIFPKYRRNTHKSFSMKKKKKDEERNVYAMGYAICHASRVNYTLKIENETIYK